MVEVRTQTRGSHIQICWEQVYVGYVGYGQKYYFRVIRNFTRPWALMISNDTQSPFDFAVNCLCCIVVKEIKFLFILIKNLCNN